MQSDLRYKYDMYNTNVSENSGSAKERNQFIWKSFSVAQRIGREGCMSEEEGRSYSRQHKRSIQQNDGAGLQQARRNSQR